MVCVRTVVCFGGDILGLCRRDVRRRDVFIRLILLPAMTKVGCSFARISRSQRLVSGVVGTRVCKHHFFVPAIARVGRQHFLLFRFCEVVNVYLELAACGSFVP